MKTLSGRRTACDHDVERSNRTKSSEQVLSEDNASRSNNLELLITKEQMREQPQYYIKTLSAGSNSADKPERLLSDFPHPYPSIRDLQREVIRLSFLQLIYCPASFQFL